MHSCGSPNCASRTYTSRTKTRLPRISCHARAQLLRPAFRNVRELKVKFLPYGALEQHRESMARFGTGIKPLDPVARTLN
jgi:hypothetical protein